jgi:hypothetical protein
MAQRERIMYIERKSEGLWGPARIGRVSFNRTGKTLTYQGHRFARAEGFKSNFYDVETGEEYWISGCKRRGGDALYSTRVEIDEDVREEYWLRIRGEPEKLAVGSFHCVGKYSKG